MKAIPIPFLKKSTNLPPSIPGPPIWQTWRYVNDAGGLFQEGFEKFGDAFTIDMVGYGTMVVFSDEESVKRVLAGRTDEFQHANEIVAFFVGMNSIFLKEGDPHKHARRRTLSAFAGERLALYGDAMIGAADRWIDGLTVGSTTSAVDGGTTMTLDIILGALFGIKPGPEHDRLADGIREFMKGGHTPVASFLSYALPAQTMRGLMLGDRNPRTMEKRELNLAGRIAGLLPPIRRGRELNEALLRIVKERSEHLDEGGEDGISHILRTARAEGHAYDDAAAFDEAMTLLLAGHDTTAITLASLLYRVSKAPAVLKKIRAEIKEHFGDGPIDPEKINSLRYLDAVVKEGFRLDGLSRGTGRRLVKDLHMRGYDLPKGTIVMGYVYPSQRDKALWEEPDQFDPDQFMGKRVKAHHFTPYGGGYRRCAGAAFADYELRILLARIAQRVDFRAPEGYAMEQGMLGPIIAPKGPVPIEITAIHPA